MRAAGSTDTRTGGGCGPRDVANAWSARHQLVPSFGVPNLLGASRQYRAIGAHRVAHDTPLASWLEPNTVDPDWRQLNQEQRDTAICL